jgi:CBS domain-containing membrane protein
MDFREFFASFKPGFDPIPLTEKFRSGFAALIGILLLGSALHFLPHPGYPLAMLASMAAAAVLLYAVPHSPMAQPWPLICGNVISALVGWGCSLLVPDPVWAGAGAVGLSVFAMHLAHCLHPPGAATAIAMVLNAAQFQQQGGMWTAATVLANAAFSLLLAIAINNVIPGRHYPARRPIASTQRPAISCELKREDIEWALTQMDSVIDVSEDDLIEIYQMAAGHAARGRK